MSAPQQGYNLVALMVILAVINIAVAAALPMWSAVIQRDQESELLFRGWQYAEAIRVFQARFGRYPVSLEELAEVKPRCIRQLWDDPLSDSGAWRPILAGTGQQRRGAEGTPGGPVPGQDLAAGRAPGRPSIQARDNREDDGPTAFDNPRSGGRGTPDGELGPIEGVRPSAEGSAMKSFLGSTEYSDWEFRASLLAAESLSPGGVPRSPRIGPDGMSRPLPESVQPAQGSAPGAVPGRRATPDGRSDRDG